MFTSNGMETYLVYRSICEFGQNVFFFGLSVIFIGTWNSWKKMDGSDQFGKGKFLFRQNIALASSNVLCVQRNLLSFLNSMKLNGGNMNYEIKAKQNNNIFDVSYLCISIRFFFNFIYFWSYSFIQSNSNQCRHSTPSNHEIDRGNIDAQTKKNLILK